MDAPRLLTLAFAGLAVAALVAPTAAAHTAVPSADGKVRGSIGLLNEPVSTYAVTGLDLCFTTAQATSSARTPLAVANPADFSATLKAPNGMTEHQDLKAQFGRTGCLTFSEPLVLTQPGQYTVDFTGSINGTTFSATAVAAGGKVVDRGNITFPASAVPSDLDLEARINALQSRIAALEADETGEDDREKGAPMPAAAWLIVGLAALAAVRRMR